jgi:hypothetical protein
MTSKPFFVPGKLYRVDKFDFNQDKLPIYAKPVLRNEYKIDSLKLNEEFLVLSSGPSFWIRIALCHEPVVGWVSCLWFGNASLC